MTVLQKRCQKLLDECDRLTAMRRVLQAGRDGKALQGRMIGEDEWEDGDDWIVGLAGWEYRIKPEPKYRPFAPSEAGALLGMEVTGEAGSGTIDTVSLRGVEIDVIAGTWSIPFDSLLNDWKFPDGTPCGVLIESEGAG